MSKLKPDSLLSLVFPSDPQVSPDGQQVVFVLSSIEEENLEKIDQEFAKPRYRGRLWWSDGKVTRQLTHGESGRGDSSPRWSPDGETIAFVRSSGEVKGALMLLPARGGEARRVTRFKQGVGGVKWSPDGRYLCFQSGGDTEDKRDERGEARVITRPRYRFNGLDWLPETPAKLWLYDVHKDKLSEWYAPERGMESVVWLPDSSGVLFVAATDEKAAYEWRNEVFSLNLKGKVKQLTRWNSGIMAAVPHPDGKQFALIGRPEGSGNTEYSHIYLVGGDKITRLDEGHDHPVGNSVAGDCHVGAMPGTPVWLDDQTLVFSSTVRGSVGLFRASLTGQPRVSAFDHHPEQVISAFTANAQGVALIRESPTRFPEVELNGQTVTTLGEHLTFQPVPPHKVTFQNELGEGEGWVMLPDLKKKQKAPALLNIHGGPHTDYGYGFQHEFQLFAANGYGVCYSNPRGSSGYGQAWQSAIHGRWGSVDYDDLMAFFDACLKAYPALDARKTAVMGGSYGGLMTNWITAHTGRFQAAITDRSICNYLSFNGTSDIGLSFWPHELGLSFHRSADAQKLWDLSPLKYVENVKTPTLIIHSALDHRCPIEQAEQWYAALTLLDVPVRFVRFPGEDHELSRSGRPDRRLKRLSEYLDWLGRWL
ncbi:S9 family peptidase [Deinococcus cavernae]|uniref:S9 family peptidase n=1 Tax=Deinococcus cavernae TaxID=2320857 RepID=A0A418V9R9_9DEIO|nr:S9 family peptidase [Deinococcus cavernae]RJF72833.1 S9 family peptidase [Deinococcus cavernae]